MRFNVEREVNGVIQFIRDYYKENHLKGAILGISGGKDSGVVAGLMVKALGPENVIGVTLPCHSKEEDKQDAILVSETYGFPLINLDITPAYEAFQREVQKLGNFSEEEKENSDINLKPRLRMASLYYLAALYSSLNGGPYLVIGTSNRCEIYVGYFTKGGDNVHDISPIADFTVDEVIQIGEYLNVPEKVLYKTPDDGLSGKSDEEKLGVTYREIAMYMEDPETVSKSARNVIERHHRNNQHKFKVPTYRKDG